MGTSFEEIESMAMTYIKNDPELDFNLANRRAVYFNTMTAYMKMAIPLFNRPPEIIEKLRKHTEPLFGDSEVKTDTEQSGIFTINTGLIGYDICSVGVIEEDKFGQTVYRRAELTGYDSASGRTEIRGSYPAETIFTAEGYKGAEFEAELNETEKEILAYAVYDAHEHRLDNDVLERMLKITDRSFTTRSEANHMQANTARQTAVDRQLFAKMRAYQDNLEYMKIVMNTAY